MDNGNVIPARGRSRGGTGIVATVPGASAGSPPERPALPGALAPEAVRLQLERILASPEFKGSERLRAFLRFVVGETLDGRADRIKGYAIAVAVFNRDETFDPQTDPIVRIEASRLRRGLERYYFTTGLNDPIRIDIPKGGYVPHFAVLQSEAIDKEVPPQGTVPEQTAGDVGGFPAEPTRWRLRKRRAAGLFGGLLAIAIITTSLALWPAIDDRRTDTTTGAPAATGEHAVTGPSVIVRPFTDLEDGQVGAVGDPFSRGITEDLISELTRFRELFVYAPATAFGGDPALEAGALRRDLGVDYVLNGSVRRDGDRIRIGAQLVNTETGAVVWADAYQRNLAAASIFDVQVDIARRIAVAIAQPYGAIATFDWERVRGHAPESLAAYECVLQAYEYRRLLDLKSLPAVRACLERAVQEEPDYADAWAMLALAYTDENRFQPLLRGSSEDLGRALQAAERAVDLAPDSAHACRALMAALFLQGRVDEAFDAGEHALTLNPNSSEVLAELGLRHVIAENGERGLALIRQAIARNPVPPDWYRTALVLGLYRNGAYDDAAREAAKTQPRPSFVYWAILTAVYAQADRRDEAEQAKRELLALYPEFAEHAWAEMTKRSFDPQLAAKLVAAWRRAGLDVPFDRSSSPRDPAQETGRFG